jgi:hypothetical protein
MQNDKSSYPPYHNIDFDEDRCEDGWLTGEFGVDDELPGASRGMGGFGNQAMGSTSMDLFDAEPPVYRSLAMLTPQQPAMSTSSTSVHEDMFFEPNAEQQHQQTIQKDARARNGDNGAVFFHGVKVPPQHFQPPTLGPFIQLERTHFRCMVPTSEIVGSIRIALENLDIVHVFKQDSFKFKCSADTPHSTVEFHVRIFADSYEQIVEFQRRNGCSVGFSLVYNNLLSAVAHLHERSIEKPMQMQR